MKHILMFLLVFILSSVGNLIAQEDNDISLHLFGTFSLPTGDYGKDITDNSIPTRRFGFNIGDDIGLATTGFGAGAELTSAVWFKGLQWMFSVNYILNPAENSALEPVYNDLLSDTTKSVSVDFELGKWINIPIFSGFQYNYNISSDFMIYGMLQGGMNFSRRPSQKAVVQIVPSEASTVVARSDLVAEDTSYEFARDFGFGTGMGIVFKDRINLGVRYFNLSQPKYEGTRQLSEKVFPEIYARENYILGEERSISMLLVTLGIVLF